MKSYFKVCWLIVAALAMGFPDTMRASPPASAPPSLSLTIRIYDYAEVAEDTLARASQEIERIYRMAGVQVVLMRCRTDMAEPILDARCEDRTGPTTIIVRILTQEMAALAGVNRKVFGFAMTASKPGFGVIASAFHHQVTRLATDLGYDKGVVLGHVISHEVGHLLLGFAGHSRFGIMQIPWNGPQLSSAHKGALLFSRQQAARIRSEVSERIRAELLREAPGDLRAKIPAEYSRSGGL